MKTRSSGYVRLVSLAVALSLISFSIASSQETAKTQQAREQAARNLELARKIEQSVDTGIFVDKPKVYDDSSLQLMLNAARARLASLQTIDSSVLMKQIGAITGATLQQQSIGAQVMGPPLPSIASTSLGSTGSTQVVSNTGGPTVNTTAPTGPTSSVTNTNLQTTTTSSGLPVQNVVTTTPQTVATVPTAPSNATALPSSGFGVSSLDALNEMMQLTYEIANLQLLLEGSLTDRFVKGQRNIKPRTTLGFPINLTAQKAYKDAVAVVEVEAINPSSGTFSDEPPTVTALLPREKTYNVAAITDRMTSIGGGFATQVINGGFSFVRGRKSYYIVQDQDTLATMHRNPSPSSTLFSWEFRPVLGQHYVRSGMKQTFVQLANPIPAAAGCFGKIKVRTYWRKYDRDHGILKEVIPDSIREDEFQPIPVFDLAPVVENVDLKDLGSGQVSVSLTGQFISGTHIRVGANDYREGSPGFVLDLKQLHFVAASADIAKYGAYIVSRDGTETEIVDSSDPIYRSPVLPPCEEAQVTNGFQISIPERDRSINWGGRTKFTISLNSTDGLNRTYDFTAQSALPMPGIQLRLEDSRITGPNLHTTRELDLRAERTASPGTYLLKIIVTTNDNQRFEVPISLTINAPKPRLTIDVDAYDSSNSVLIANLSDLPSSPEIEDYVILIGGRVLGLSDAPIERTILTQNQATLRVVLPNSFLVGVTKAEVKPLLWKNNHSVSASIGNFRADGSIERIVLLDQNTAGGRFLLYGSRLTSATMLIPSPVALRSYGNISPDILREFDLTPEQLKNFKQIVIEKAPGERPIILALPAVAAEPRPALTVNGRVTVGANEITVFGDLDNLRSVTLKNKPITLVRSHDKKSAILVGLRAAGATKLPTAQEFVFEFEDGKKVKLKIDIVNSIVETVERK